MSGSRGTHPVRLVGGVAAAVTLTLAALPSAEVEAQIPRGKVVRLAGDTDEAVGLAKQVRSWLFSHPAALSAAVAGKTAIVQTWLEDRTLDQLTDKERFLLANPESYERPMVTDITVQLGPPVAVLALAWDVPLRLWPTRDRGAGPGGRPVAPARDAAVRPARRERSPPPVGGRGGQGHGGLHLRLTGKSPARAVRP